MTKIFNLIELITHNKPTLGKEEEEAVEEEQVDEAV